MRYGVNFSERTKQGLKQPIRQLAIIQEAYTKNYTKTVAMEAAGKDGKSSCFTVQTRGRQKLEI